MRTYERFAFRIDQTPVNEVPTSELRTRIELLDAELSQLAHDEEHVKVECYGMDLFHHLKTIASDRTKALAKKEKYLSILSGRGV